METLKIVMITWFC